MRKIKEVYKIEIDDNLEIEFEMNECGNITVTKAEEYVYHEELDWDEFTYCKPNIRFTIIPYLDVKEQIEYHLCQRDRINKIKNNIENTKKRLREKGIR